MRRGSSILNPWDRVGLFSNWTQYCPEKQTRKWQSPMKVNTHNIVSIPSPVIILVPNSGSLWLLSVYLLLFATATAAVAAHLADWRGSCVIKLCHQSVKFSKSLINPFFFQRLRAIDWLLRSSSRRSFFGDNKSSSVSRPWLNKSWERMLEIMKMGWIVLVMMIIINICRAVFTSKL